MMTAASADAPATAAVAGSRYGSYSPVMALTASNTESWTIAMTRAWLNGFVATAVLAAMSFHFRTMSSALAGAGPETSATSNTAVDTLTIDRTAAPRRLLIPEVIALSFSEAVDVSCVAGRWHTRD